MDSFLESVFNDTVNKSKAFTGKFSDTTKHQFSDIIEVDKSILKDDFKSNISVIGKDSVSALVANRDSKVCLLNMASYKRPGGGVANGAKAQEECLFRCSNLMSTISEAYYPLDTEDTLYTIDATFFKDKDYNPMEAIECDVVTSAAFNISKGPRSMPRNYSEQTLKKIRLMLSLAIRNNVEVIILGAWGCGVFKNEPLVMARLFHRVLVKEKYQQHFKKVVFPVINDKNSTGNNLLIFERELNGK